MSDQYFKNLNYTMSNEDTEFEYTLLAENTDHVLSICGSGSRVVPLLAKSPRKLSIVDYSSEQLALAQMRILAIKNLEHEQFLKFFGYKKGMSAKERYELFHKFDFDNKFKIYLITFFEQHEWQAPLYLGNYEKALIKISSIIHPLFGVHVKRLKKEVQHKDFLNYLETQFPRFRWKLILFLVGNSTFLNAILYKGNHPKKNIPKSYSQYYRELFSKLFSFLTPRESFFLQMIFFGEIIDLKGAPFEASVDIYTKMKKGIENCDISYYQGEVLTVLNDKIDSPINFISFSDILSYFDEDIETIYLQKIKHKLCPKALTVHRYYLRVNYGLNTEGFTKRTEDFLDLIKKEKTQIYDIDIYQRD